MLNNVTAFSPLYTKPVFSAFAKPASSAIVQNDLQVDDHFLDPKRNLGGKQALGWFMTGMALSAAGRWTWRGLVPKNLPSKAPLQFETNNILHADADKQNILTIYQSFIQSLHAIYRLALIDPSHRKTLLAYTGSSVLGYVAGSVAQGTQEAWVRREETKIRARLVNQLGTSVQQSIRTKLTFNNQLKEDAKQAIREMLQRQGLSDVDALIQDVPVAESLDANRLYPWQPTHRKLPFGSALTPDPVEPPVVRPNPESLQRLQKSLLLGLGALTGTLLYGVTRLLKASPVASVFKGQKQIFESLQLNDNEAWWVNGIKNRQNFLLMMGFFGLSAMAKAGQLLVDAFREIQVTRVNAQTELSYQSHNWLSQDPAFHAIAERESLQNDLRLLEAAVPTLKQNPALLRERVQTILQNVGRNSAPPYYQMVPQVNLSLARA